MGTLLIIEPDLGIRQALQESLPVARFQIAGSGPSEVARAIQIYDPALIIIGPSFAEAALLQMEVTKIRACAVQIPLLLVTLRGSEELAVAALRTGITEYLRYPWQAEDLDAALKRCLRDRNDWSTAAAPRQQDCRETTPILGESGGMQRVRDYLFRAGAADSTMLITGETGTGKELAAQFAHQASPRRNHPLITVNCAAIPDSLLESELFGYEKGAFTGAQCSKDGRLRAADRGTVFLDEIGDMSLVAQAKILRVMEAKEIQKLGRNTSTPVDVRIIAATNRDIETLMAEDKFRQDLYYRLNIARIHIPPLRERKEDIPSIVHYYVKVFNRQFRMNISRLTDDAWDYLLSYTWPGNVRELKNVLEAGFLQGSSCEISVDQLRSCRWRSADRVSQNPMDEQKQLLSALLSTNWNKSKAAEKLRWSRMTLYRKIAKYGISKVQTSAIGA